MLVTSRTESSDDDPTESLLFESGEIVSHFHLERLAQLQARKLVATIAHAQLAESSVNSIVARADGNPLFVE